MSDAGYRQLLDATLQYLESRREHGVRHVHVSSALLAELERPKSARTGAKPTAVAPGSPARRPAAPAVVEKPSAPAKPVVPAQPAVVEQRPAAERPPVSAPASSPQVLPLLGAPGRALSPAEKESAMAALRARALVCRKCEHLAAARRNVVFGVGDIHSPLMFVGEAPGADEDAQGEPFVGKAGQLLTRIIQTMGLGRDRVYIANILKCRPDTPGQSSGNRKPTPTEMGTCLPYLLEQIQIIRPRVIVALGATAVEGLMGKTDGITRARGQWLTFQDTPVMPTYHPAYLLRNQSMAVKRLVWEDMLAVMERLGLPITEKQRGYFLRS
ncbi:MAG: uracil-DNA glycosylase [Verrucomicrobiales bacterium]|nr:uracil-DNA glycosylase [Verrucomicrobiales bacterium]